MEIKYKSRFYHWFNS